MAVRQRVHPALEIMATRPGLFAKQGTVVANWRYSTGRRSGPYYELSYREAGRQRSIYLGRAGPLVEQVRQMLAALQTAFRRKRAYDKMCRRVRAALRGHKADLNARLRALGLRLQGNEVRGWRTAPLVPKIRL